MKAQLSISLLGSGRILFQENFVDGFESIKVRALLAFLTVEAGERHPRAKLAGLFWPEFPEARARRNLSQAVYNIGQCLPDAELEQPFLLKSRDFIIFNPKAAYVLDVAEFNGLVSAVEQHDHSKLVECESCLNRLTQAVALYRGDFLGDLYLGDNQFFDEWVLMHRERLRRGALAALENLVSTYEARDDLTRALQHAWQLVEIDPLLEAGYRHLMDLLFRTGNRTTALAQYKICANMLATELGVEPEPDTQTLYHRIQAAPLAELAPTSKIPQYAEFNSPLFGRQQELAQLTSIFENPACRLVNLIGPGGIGKTRLAVASIASLERQFAEGVYFVRLEDLESPAFFFAAMAQGIKFYFPEAGQPEKQQLLDYLKGKTSLLILDSFEYCLPQTPILSEILQYCPRVKILVTSRQELGLREEWQIHLGGLAYPAAVAAGDFEKFSALQLFAFHANRINPQFACEQHAEHILQIVQYLQGMPLAIELLAGWIKTFSAADLSREAQQNLELFSTNLQNFPDKHRSIAEVLEQSWGLLTAREKDVFLRLTAFTGEFDFQAAKQIARVTPYDLASLIGKSFIQKTRKGKYRIHRLLQQFGDEKLSRKPAVARRVRARHSHYFAQFVCSLLDDLKGGRQNQALEKIEIEIDNIRTGWDWAVKNWCYEDLNRYLNGLYIYYGVRGIRSERLKVFDLLEPKINAILGEAKPLDKIEGRFITKVLSVLGATGLGIRKVDECYSLVGKSISLAEEWGLVDEQGFGYFVLALIERHSQNFSGSRAASLQSIALLEKTGNHYQLAGALNGLGVTTAIAGEYQEAEHIFRRCLAIAEDVGDLREQVSAITHLGNIAFLTNDLDQAEQLYRESLILNENIGAVSEAAVTHSNLGLVALRRGEYAQAKQLINESIEIKNAIGAYRSAGRFIKDLADVHLEAGDLEQAKACYLEAWELVDEDRIKTRIILGLAKFFHRVGELEKAALLTSRVDHTVVRDRETQAEVEQLVSELRGALSSDQFEAAWAKGKSASDLILLKKYLEN